VSRRPIITVSGLTPDERSAHSPAGFSQSRPYTGPFRLSSPHHASEFGSRAATVGDLFFFLRRLDLLLLLHMRLGVCGPVCRRRKLAAALLVLGCGPLQGPCLFQIFGREVLHGLRDVGRGGLLGEPQAPLRLGAQTLHFRHQGPTCIHVPSGTQILGA